MRKWALPAVLALLTLLAFFWVLHTTQSKIGSAFPGYLRFSNGVVGIFYLPSWQGHQTLQYPQTAPEVSLARESFSRLDYFYTVLLPAATGLLLVLFGLILYLYLYPGRGLYPLAIFHFLLGNFIILLAEAQVSAVLPPLFLLFLIFLPPTLFHFSLMISESLVEAKARWLYFFLPYLLSALLAGPFVYLYQEKPHLWVQANLIVLGYGIVVYLFWLIRLVGILQKPYLEMDRLFAKWLLIAQLFGLFLPGTLLLGAQALGASLPANIASPLLLVFPAALLVGMIPVKNRQKEIYIIQSEKRSTFGNLLSGLAHELNNPLTFIYSNIDPMRDTVDRIRSMMPQSPESSNIMEEMGKMIDGMEEGAKRSKALIDNFRDLPYQKTGAKEEVAINDILEKTLQILEPRWKGRIQLKTRFEKTPLTVGYPTDLEQAFTNILSNAFDATPAGGAVTVTTHGGATGVRITVRDTGPGIPFDQQRRIFDPLFTTKPQGKGMGLGLAITLQKIKNHKGTIEVHSSEGNGTEFLIFIPYSS